MIRKNKSIASQFREMQIGQTITIGARSGIPIKTLETTARRLKKEGYWYSLSVVGLPKGACAVTRIYPRPARRAYQIVVHKAVFNEPEGIRFGATELTLDYSLDGEEHKGERFPIIYDQYEYWQRKIRLQGEEAANRYIAKLIEDSLQ